MSKTEWTLSEIARLLRQPQHRLIYLCEKGVITPDFADAKGRGSSRRFSARNIFEISIALTLSEFHFPGSFSANILYLLRSFETSVRKFIGDFNLPYSLMTNNSPEIIGIVTNGSILNFAIGLSGQPKKVYGGIDISESIKDEQLKFEPVELQDSTPKTQQVNTPFGDQNLARFEINITKIAQSLELD